MADRFVSFEIVLRPPFRDIRGRFAKAERGLLRDRREGMREEGRRFVLIAQEEAPKRTGRFAAGIRYRTFIDGETLGFTATTPQPLGRWILEGTGIYGPRGTVIRPVRAQFLRFVIGGQVFYRRFVRGMRANKFIGRAYRRWLPGAREYLLRTARNYTRTIAGSSG